LSWMMENRPDKDDRFNFKQFIKDGNNIKKSKDNGKNTTDSI